MNAWPLYRLLERALQRDLVVELVARDGLVIRDADGRQWWLTAQEWGVPA